jgi:signal transduction histidine kinase/nitrate reductase NapE component
MLNSLRNSLYVKVLAFCLFVITFVAFIGGALGTVYMVQEGYYDPEGSTFYNSAICRQTTQAYADTVYKSYFWLTQTAIPAPEYLYQIEQYEEQFSAENTNFFFYITDMDSKVILSNMIEQDYAEPLQFSYIYNDFEYSQTKYFTVTAFVKMPITAQDDYTAAKQKYDTLHSMRYVIAVLTVISAILAVFLFVYLLAVSGRNKGKEGITLRGYHRIPLDIFAAGVLWFWIDPIAYFFRSSFEQNYPLNYINNQTVGDIARGMIMTLAGVILLTLLCISFAARVKAGKWWENTILYRILSLLLRWLRMAGLLFSDVFANLPLLWKAILLFTGFLLVNGILVIAVHSMRNPMLILLALLLNLTVLAGICIIMLQMNRLKMAGIKIADGDFSSKMDTTGLMWDLKTHGETLNNIGGGMQKAVEEQLRTERFKTELITNVSHDLKTPITSIVNYVDLLKKENLPNEKAREYIEVLDRQSARLKKLTEDLVEASKASTGNISMSPVKTNITELLHQSIGEYAERFEDSKLEVILHTPLEEVYIMADGKLMWRVFDNLLSNIYKYSQKGTRVYLDMAATPDTITVTLKNISQYALNITTDELLERFVRGDSARATDGSGLGLSIAKSLIELQKGTFALSVDGDLFKVVIGFERIAWQK